jgi:hypothetical protein
LNKSFSEPTKDILTNLRSYRVRECYPGVNFDILEKTAQWQPDHNKKHLIIFGSRDVPEILKSCVDLQERGVPVIKIDNALHSDIFLNDQTFNTVVDQLRNWFYQILPELVD